MSGLSQEQLREALRDLPEWQEESGYLVMTRELASFAEATEFVVAVAAIAEELDHHPDFEIRYTRVRLRVNSHDVGAITRRDVRLASRVAALRSSPRD